MLERPKFRSRVERDLVKRDLRFLDRFAFFKTRSLLLWLIGCANADFWRRPAVGVPG
jgi:hypothetical protein